MSFEMILHLIFPFLNCVYSREMGHLDILYLFSLFFYLVFTSLLTQFHDQDKLTLDPESVDLELGCK